MRHDVWTEEELKALREFYPYSPMNEVMKMIPNRTWGSITDRAKKVKVKRMVRDKSDGSVIRMWEDDEVKKLKEKYPYTPDGDLEELFGREVTEVKRKAKAMGLKKDKSVYEDDREYRRKRLRKWSEEDLDTLKTYYPLEGAKGVHRRMPHHKVINIIGQASNYNLSAPQEFIWEIKKLEVDKDNIFSIKANIERVN